MFDLKVLNPKAATKLVTLVTILGLASGCVHEQVKNDDPAMDLPALTLNDPAKEQMGPSTDDLNLEGGAASVADSSGIDTSLPAESSSMPLENTSSDVAAPALSDSSLPADSSTNLAYSTPSDLTPLAGSMMDDSTSKSTPKKMKKAKNKKSKIAKHGKRKSTKLAGGKKAKKNHKVAKADKAKQPETTSIAALDAAPPAPPAPPSSDALTIDGAPDAAMTAGTTGSAPTDSAMTLPADSEIGSHETTTIEPPLALSQAPDISSSDDGSIWIYWGAGMVILVGAVLLFVKRRRTAIRY